MTAKVLIVDDSSLARRTTRQHVEALGHSVEVATDGIQALEIVSVAKPELVILDMVMVGLGGLDALTKMREMFPDIRVIVVTADIQQSTYEEVKAAGAKGMLNKPINRERLASAIGTVLSGGETWS